MSSPNAVVPLLPRRVPLHPSSRMLAPSTHRLTLGLGCPCSAVKDLGPAYIHKWASTSPKTQTYTAKGSHQTWESLGPNPTQKRANTSF